MHPSCFLGGNATIMGQAYQPRQRFAPIGRDCLHAPWQVVIVTRYVWADSIRPFADHQAGMRASAASVFEATRQYASV